MSYRVEPCGCAISDRPGTPGRVCARHIRTATRLPIDESSWLAYVTDYATCVVRPPWLRYHTLRSKGSDAGFPDLVLLRPPRMIVAELKTDRGNVTEAQTMWLDAFSRCGAEVYVWRPRDRDEMEARLR